MSWKDLLIKNESFTFPWCGESDIYHNGRYYKLGKRPKEFGWATFEADGRKADFKESVDADTDLLTNFKSGYLIGNLLLREDVPAYLDPSKIHTYGDIVNLIPEGTEKFSRIKAGKVQQDMSFVFCCEDFPAGPENDVLNAYLDRSSIDELKNVPSSLVAAFHYESWRRADFERRQAEAEARRIAEEAKKAEQDRLKRLAEELGTGEGRRAMAALDFATAAKAALAIGGATYLDYRKVGQQYFVKYRVANRRLECICDAKLSILDAGICLTDHETDERGDNYFTLESLPMVVLEAINKGVLVVWRHG